MFRTFARATLALAVPVLALVSSSSASASAVPGFDGKARVNSDANCFIESWGSALNTCGTDKDINYALPVASSGTNTATFYTSATAVTTANICRTFSVGPTGGITTGGTVNMQVGSANAIASSVYVPSWGAMWGVCTVPANGKILHVHN
ncbi:MAG TPA: hypothetical protein VGI39_27840 [Polyangiaceae bacterium]|jgi:hypothetical protein